MASSSRYSSMAAAKRVSAIQWADQVGVGSRPRAILCSPCAPPSKLAWPCAMQYSMDCR
ncbi:Uncharacterised protein [Bordetella pertussis]|nr:Uncharacterised protein [Bordetella pertussis]